LLLINIFNLQYFFLTGYVSWTWAEPNGAVCRDARAEWRPPQGGATLRGTYLRSTILFCKLLFSWIEYDDFFFNFQETYNSRLRERYGDNPSTHLDFNLDLWMEVGSFGGPDKNRVCGLSNTTTENLRAAVVSQPMGAPNQYRAPNLRS